MAEFVKGAVGGFIGGAVASKVFAPKIPDELKVVAPSYIIYKDGDIVKAKNGKTGAIEFSSTDATSVIQQAINALASIGGGEIFVRDGVYSISNTIYVASNISIKLSHNAVLSPSGTFNNMFTNSDWSNGNQHISIVGGRFIGNKTGNPIIAFRNVRYLTIKDVYISKLAYQWDAIIVSLSKDVRIVRPIIEENGAVDGAGIGIRGCENVFIDSPIIRYANADGIWIGYENINVPSTVYSKNVYVRGGVIEFCGRCGIWDDVNNRNVVIDGVIARNNGQRKDSYTANNSGIRVLHPYFKVVNCTVFDDQATKTQDWGISLETISGYDVVDYGVVKNNIVYGNKTGAIHQYNVGRNIIIVDNPGYPVDILKGYLQPSIGLNNAYGSPSSWKSPSGMFRWFRIKITWSGSFAINEIVTVKIEVVYNDGSTAILEKSATASGSIWLSEDEYLYFQYNQKPINEIRVYAKTSASSTSVSVLVDIYGHG